MIRASGARAALYARVSLEEQARHGFSIEGQLDALRKYCEANGIQVYDTYIDAGASGGKMAGRPELKRLLSDAERGKFDVVMVWRISRLSRNLSDLLHIVERLKQHKIALYSLNEQFDTDTPLGQFVLQMFGAAAQMERSTIADNVRLTMNHRSMAGIWNSGNSVLGYRWVRDPETGEGKVEIVPEEAAVVRQIFEWYATGKLGYKAIANRLNHAGVRTKSGKPFSIQSVRYILTNRNYIGLVRYNKTESIRTRGAVPAGWAHGTHEPIVDQELWDRVQAILAKRSHPPVRKISRSFPLSGLLKCPQCGSGMVPGHTKSRRKDGTFRIYFYYVCGAYNAKGSVACRPNSVRADDIENWFFGQLQQLLASPTAIDRITGIVNNKLNQATKPAQDQLKLLDEQLAHLEAEQRQLFQSFEAGKITGGELSAALQDIKRRRQDCSEERERLERQLSSIQHHAISVEKIRSAILQLRKLLESQSIEQQKRLIELLVEKVTLPRDRNIEGAVLHGSSALLNIQLPISNNESITEV